MYNESGMLTGSRGIGNGKNEIAREPQTQRATSRYRMSKKNIKTPEGVHRITHPACYACGTLMILLHDGKLCPACGRLALASQGWKRDHPQVAARGES
jgi:hypothetical protein